jgi:hypothetical protein
MAKQSILPLFLGPSSVSIHDDGDMLWKALQINILLERHSAKLVYLKGILPGIRTLVGTDREAKRALREDVVVFLLTESPLISVNFYLTCRSIVQFFCNIQPI